MRRSTSWLCVFGLMATGCSASETSNPTTTIAEQLLDRPVPDRTSDGTLTIGLTVPAQILSESEASDLVEISQALALDLNSATTPAGMPVRLVVAAETGDLERDRETLDELISREGIDATIGLFSSYTAGALAPIAFDAGIGVCSPAASSIGLESLPDSGLMIRTRPGDRTVLEGMAKLASQAGYSRAIVLYPDDPYGRSAMETLNDFFEARGVSQPVEGIEPERWVFPYTIDGNDVLTTDYDPEVIADRVVVLIADEAAAETLLDTIDLSRVVQTVIVNDAFVDQRIDDPEDGSLSPLQERTYIGAAVDHFAGWTNLMAELSVTAPDVTADLEPIPFVTGIADCLNVLALSAIAAGSDLATNFMQLAESTTTGGTPCVFIRECLLIEADGRDVDYQGPTGELALDENGDAVSNSFLKFQFGPDGLAQVIQPVRLDQT